MNPTIGWRLNLVVNRIVGDYTWEATKTKKMLSGNTIPLMADQSFFSSSIFSPRCPEIRRRLFTELAVQSFVVFMISGMEWALTMHVESEWSVDNGLSFCPTIMISASRWLGWLTMFFMLTTVGLIVERSQCIRLSRARVSSGPCGESGYDHDATPGQCPACKIEIDKPALAAGQASKEI